MTNGEEDKEEINQVPDQSVPPVEEVNQVPDQSVPPVGEVNPVPDQSAPPAKSSNKNIIFIVLGILAVCCVGVIVVVALGGGSFELGFNLFDSGPKYRNETVSGYQFKIPDEYEKMKEDVGGMVEFKNDTNKFVRIDSVDQRYDLYTWSLAIQAVLGGPSGSKVDLNGTPAYRFEVEDIFTGGKTEQTVYAYALNLDGKSFFIVISKGVENPNEFLTTMIS